MHCDFDTIVTDTQTESDIVVNVWLQIPTETYRRGWQQLLGCGKETDHLTDEHISVHRRRSALH